ncbi:hypothetical protein [Streptomyces sp. NBC_01314]|nr:hypothetical protein OG622_08820 [Streptomyces sp. NBC_01314]
MLSRDLLANPTPSSDPDTAERISELTLTRPETERPIVGLFGFLGHPW